MERRGVGRREVRHLKPHCHLQNGFALKRGIEPCHPVLLFLWMRRLCHCDSGHLSSSLTPMPYRMSCLSYEDVLNVLSLSYEDEKPVGSVCFRPRRVCKRSPESWKSKKNRDSFPRLPF